MRRLAWILLLSMSLAGVAGAQEQGPATPEVVLQKVATLEEAQQALSQGKSVYLPPGEYNPPRSLVLENLDGVYLIGAGRGRSAALLQFAPGEGLVLKNCRNVTLCNLWIQGAKGEQEGACVDVVGDQPGTISLLNCFIAGNNILKPGDTGLPDVRVRAPVRLLLQGTHLSHGDPGLLLDHPQAEVTMLGGNCQSTTRHLVQKRGYLRVYAVGFQLAHEGADVFLSTAADRPFVIAGCRSEGPRYLLATPATEEKIDVVVKGCGVASAQNERVFLDYRAAGRLWLLANNSTQAALSLGPESKATVWSLGNYYGPKKYVDTPFDLGGSTLYTAGDIWTLRTGEETYQEPVSGVITAQEYLSKGFTEIPANLVFLSNGDRVPRIPRDPPLPTVTMPRIRNAAELLPSVKQYGAVGDGQTDDTEAIERALDACRHGPLFFPAGTYRVTRPVLMLRWAGGWLVGEGPDKSVINNTAGTGAWITDGCGYTTFQDLAFVATEGAKGAAFDLSWDRNNPIEIPGYSGAALQGNNFYRCRFQGGEYGLSIGTAGWMGSESLLMECEFMGASEAGLATRNYNALTNNAVNCLFKGNRRAAQQVSAGSFNILGCRFEDSRDFDLLMVNSAADCFYIADTTTNGRKLLATGHTGARINIVFDNMRVLNTDPAGLDESFYVYPSGGGVVWLGGTPGGGRISVGGSIAGNSHVFVGTKFYAENPVAVSGRASYWVLEEE